MQFSYFFASARISAAQRGAFSGVSTQGVSSSGSMAWEENPITSKPLSIAATTTASGVSFPSHHVVCVW